MYTQIGIVTLIGLAAKNAILIVEFAKLRREEGMSIEEAAMEAAHLRLRPILMTSFAFILGVTPLLIATGAGAASRRAHRHDGVRRHDGATLLAVFIVPVLYVVVERIRRARKACGRTHAGRRGVTRGVTMKRYIAVLIAASCSQVAPSGQTTSGPPFPRRPRSGGAETAPKTGPP